MAEKFDAISPPRRFYAKVGVAADETGFTVRLDGRVPRSPRAAPLVLPTFALAALIAAEWDAQGERVAIAAMPATRLAWTALDGVAPARIETADSVARVAAADQLCYFADGPATLFARQQALWSPLLDWARIDLGLAFERTAGVVHKTQPPATLAAVQALAANMDDFTLAGLAFGSALFSSAILAIALARGRIGGAQAFAAAQLDEIFQAERWGVDAEAKVRADALAADAAMLDAWFRALREG